MFSAPKIKMNEKINTQSKNNQGFNLNISQFISVLTADYVYDVTV
jgi:hypothetical protein